MYALLQPDDVSKASCVAQVVHCCGLPPIREEIDGDGIACECVRGRCDTESGGLARRVKASGRVDERLLVRVKDFEQIAGFGAFDRYFPSSCIHSAVRWRDDPFT